MTASTFLKGRGALAFAIIWLAVLAAYFLYTGSALLDGRGRLYRKNAELKEYMVLAGEYKKKAAAFAPYAARLESAPPVLMPGPLMDEMTRKVGVASGAREISQMAVEDMAGYGRQGAVVRLKEIGLNELVNLLYRIDGQTGLMMVQSFTMRPSGKKGAFDVEMEVVQAVRTAGEGGK